MSAAKCGHEMAEIGEIAATGTGLTKSFDTHNQYFRAISLVSCDYAGLIPDPAMTWPSPSF